MKEISWFLILFFASSLSNENLKWNHIQTIGTHNSYKSASVPTTPFWDYSHPNMTIQLEKGIRQFEFDLSWPSGRIEHAYIYDGVVNCLSLSWCIDHGFQSWKEKNPNHLPLFVIIELKDNMTPHDLLEFDQELTAVAKRNGMFTPDDLRAELKVEGKQTLRELILSKGWPSLDSARGKIIFMLLGNLQNYTLGEYEGLRNRTSFLMLKTEDSNLDNAAFLYDDFPQTNGDKIKELVKQGFIVRTRSDRDYRKVDPRKPFTSAYIRRSFFDIIDRPPSDFKVSKLELRNWLNYFLKDPNAEKNTNKIFEECTKNDKITEVDKENWDCFVDAFLTKYGMKEPTIQTKQEAIIQRDNAFASGAHFISTDHFQEPKYLGDYWVKMPDNIKTAYRCNPVTSNDNCSNEAFVITEIAEKKEVEEKEKVETKKDEL